MTEKLFYSENPVESFDATVVAIEDHDGGDSFWARLDRTGFYYTSGGQPHDVGHVGGRQVIDVQLRDGEIWHLAKGSVPTVGEHLACIVDIVRQQELRRIHTALHVIDTVAWREFDARVVGADMIPLSGRLDLALPGAVPTDFREALEHLANEVAAADLSVVVRSASRQEVEADPVMSRARLDLVPEAGETFRIVDVVGLGAEPDGGLHVRSTGQIGEIKITKVENKGKGVRRVRIQVSR